MKTDLTSKTATITGASGGIGKAISLMLAGQRMNLVLVGRNEKKLRETEEAAKGLGAQTFVCRGDIRDLTFTQEILSAAVERFGGLDVLINCAGLAQHDPFEEVTPAQFDDIMAVNVRAPYFLCQGALPLLRGSGMATIINICSVVAHKGYPQQSVYAASKHALLGLSKSLANEVFRDDIRVHVISPGGVFTDMGALARPDLTPDGMTLPEDIADIVLFLLEHRCANAVIDEIQVHRTNKEPFA
ncbi:MAG: SDR family oxidoreductase [Lachnospiraceae bacterium]|nr:SDR family oxidoreductase [Lachnospiraceae bacterium]